MDGTGPRGEGPRTGKGLGKCGNNGKTADKQNDCPGAGLGRKNCVNRGSGLGRRCRNKASE